MDIRDTTPEESDTEFYLSSQAFGGGGTDSSHFHSDGRLPRDTCAVYDAAGMQSKVSVIPFEIFVGSEVVVPMGGVASVTTLPASRGKGYAAACMRYALERMRERGQVVSTLFPFSWAFYQRLGWDWVGVEHRVKASTSVFHAGPETEHVRAATPADWPAIQDVYARHAKRYRGYVRRSEQSWKNLLDQEAEHFTYAYLYERDGAAEGYLVFCGGSGKDTGIDEFITLTPQAQTGLLGLLKRHEMQVEAFHWTIPAGAGTFFGLLHDDDISIKAKPVTQGRIVDVPGALSAWKPEASRSGSVMLGVTDSNAPWNEGTWRVTFEGGEVQAVLIPGEPQVSLDIRALSQAWFGTPTLAEIRTAEHLAVHDERGYAVLESLLAGPPMAMNDHF